MTIKQSISKGLGAITPSAWADIVAAVDFAAQGRTLNMLSRLRSGDRETFLARIDSSAKPTATIARWRYGWTQVRRSSLVSFGISVPVNAMTGLSTGFSDGTNGGKAAGNMLEWGNTASLAYGFATDTADGVTLQNVTGFSVQPVPNSTIVVMHAMRSESAGVLHFCFAAPNRIDGSCPSPIIDNTIDGGSF
jgi:hypothetical protein